MSTQLVKGIEVLRQFALSQNVVDELVAAAANFSNAAGHLVALKLSFRLALTMTSPRYQVVSRYLQILAAAKFASANRHLSFDAVRGEVEASK